MTERTKITGVVFSDLGQGAAFMTLPWVRESLQKRLGFAPYPATLNVRVDSEPAMAAWREVKQQGADIDLPPPESSFCHARCYLVEIDGKQRGAVVVPEIDGYPPDKIEVIAPVRLKDALPVADGERVTLEFLN